MDAEDSSDVQGTEVDLLSHCETDSESLERGSQERAVQRAVQIWLTKPQVANRRLFGCQLREGSIAAVSAANAERARLVRTLVPKNPALASATETVEWWPEQREWRFEALCSRDGHKATYSLRLGDDDEGEEFTVKLEEIRVPQNDIGWIFERDFFHTDLTDRLSHWYNQALMPCGLSAPLTSPMRLVDVERYVAVHRELKAKYGRDLIANWSERTDAQKFVFEDLAIAAYLLALWADEKESVRFADLGCGNGLLVHLLVAEGVRGVGIDVRRRAIWAKFPPATAACLMEASLDPSQASCGAVLPAGTNWLIGNHSDELTPWLPVMATRLSSSCAFFVLPCCPFDLFGKFSGRTKACSRYRTYLDFVGTLGQRCGFRMEQDVLRIPSTRRVAWIGRPSDQLWAQRVEAVDTVVREQRGVRAEFCARPAVEPVRNCTKVPVELRTRITDTVFQELLRAGEAKRAKVEGRSWNPGGTLTLHEICCMFDRQDLQELKAQHGGLQTLLRNQHQVFEVRGGEVRIRQTFPVTVRGKNAAGKQKLKAERRKAMPCWMMKNHPDGCPRSDEDCPFSHEKTEIPKSS